MFNEPDLKAAEDTMHGLITWYLQKLQKRFNERGDETINVPTMYGGTTLAEEIRLTQERLKRLGIAVVP